MIQAVPVIVVCLIGVAALKGGKPKGEMTPKRRVAFETTLKECKDPKRLREIADAFDKCGLADPWGNILRKRAALRERPPELVQKHREAFRKALLCKDPAVVENVARAFEAMGSTGCAAQLYNVARGLRGMPSETGDYKKTG